jgi:6-phosphogluconate dehydrogenase
MSCDVGLYGLAVMGQNFALNMASHGFKVCVGNRSSPKVDLTVNRAKAEGNLPLVGSTSPRDFVQQLSKPRKVVILVMAGKPVDDTIAELSKYMEKGDCVVDGGNEWFHNTLRRAKELEPKGIHFIGMGISGGEEGARNGPSLMPGGPKEAYDMIEPIITKCAAQVNDGACTGYVGPVGSGNYVKMIHNGVEYADMQLIAEVYDVMRHVLKLSNPDMAKTFADWNKGELDSYLIEITSKILDKKDDQGCDGYVVDYVLDKTGMKGTGRWTIQEAAERSVAAPTMAASLDARYISGRKGERAKACQVLKGPDMTSVEIPINKAQLLEDLGAALYCAKIISYAQGLGIIQACSDDMGWGVDVSDCARLWKGGCIIRAAVLQKIQDAMARDKNLPNLILDPVVASELNERTAAWRRVCAIAIGYGISTPALSGSLNYYDSYRRESLPANLTQAQRDFFGGHTYERTDREGVFHTAWTDAHKSIGDINERKAGEV